MKKLIDKKGTRLRRATRTRAKIRELRMARLTVHRTPRHMYAQIIDGAGEKVLVSASTVQEAVREGLKGTGNVAAAAAVGKTLAERAKAAGITAVAFDRAGFRYHGRVKALADAARAGGLVF
jgi:large subunit ribosomal protein L18